MRDFARECGGVGGEGCVGGWCHVRGEGERTMRSSGTNAYRYIHALTWPRGRRHRQRFFTGYVHPCGILILYSRCCHSVAGRKRKGELFLFVSPECELCLAYTRYRSRRVYCIPVSHVLHLESSHHAHTDTHIHAQALAHSCTHAHAHMPTHTHTHACITYTAHLDTTYTARE